MIAIISFLLKFPQEAQDGRGSLQQRRGRAHSFQPGRVDITELIGTAANTRVRLLQHQLRPPLSPIHHGQNKEERLGVTGMH